jgi:hypothetical protein
VKNRFQTCLSKCNLRRYATVDKTYRAAAQNLVETQGGAGLPAPTKIPTMPQPGGSLKKPRESAGETPGMVVKQIRFDLG